MRIHTVGLVVGAVGACSPMLAQVERLEAIARAHNERPDVSPAGKEACELAWTRAERAVMRADARWAAGEDAQAWEAMEAVDKAEKACIP